MLNLFKGKPKNVEFVAPVDGKQISLSEVPDKVFSAGMLGDGIAFLPESVHVCAPCDGKITMIADTLHAFGITGENGVEVLVHIGLDTVALAGKGFLKLEEQGHTVKKGTPIIKIDLENLKEQGINLCTPMIVLNSTEFDVSKKENTDVKAGETVVCSCIAK